MKKLLRFMPILLIAVLGFSMSACSDDDDDEDSPINPSELPVNATSFLSTYFPGVSITTSTLEGAEYEVVLANGFNIDFNLSGEWIDVDAPYGMTVPTGFYPAAIDEYLGLNMEGAGINEISQSPMGYEVETVGGIELVFSSAGTFLGYAD
ncbi:MAG: PepSY-like domain-containing protein [Muribaculaceae bacterium]|nr:PepSY-like domain-containing protein [Muribaculaceae bacterium]